MSLRMKSWSFTGFVIVLFVAFPGFAATVTVDPLGTNVPGVSYTSLRTALISVESWGDGIDTVLVASSAVHYVTANINVGIFNASSTLTIKKAGTASPIVAIDSEIFENPEASPPNYMFRFLQSGQFVVEGLTLIGAKGISGWPGENPYGRNIFGIGIEADMDEIEGVFHGRHPQVTFRNCVITANDGTDNPRLDFGGSFPPCANGTFRCLFFHGDDSFRGRITFVAENCSFAFAGDDDGLAQYGRPIADDANFDEPHTRSFTFKNCLLTAAREPISGDECNSSDGRYGNCMCIRGAGSETTINIDDCLFKRAGGSLFLLAGDASDVIWTQPVINIAHTIMDATGSGVPGGTPLRIGVGGERTFKGILNIDGLTVNRPGADVILVEGLEEGTTSFSIKNMISFNVDSLFRATPEDGDNSGPTPASLTASNLATNRAARTTQSASVQAILNAAMVTTADPAYVDTSSKLGSTYNGIRGWDSTTNDFYDIGNTTYATLGSGNTPLVGGAECPACTGSGVDDWVLY